MPRPHKLLFLVGLVASACRLMPHGYSAGGHAQPDQLEAAARAAAYNDTGCTADRVVVRSIDGHTAETNGCGVRTTYTCWRGTNERDNMSHTNTTRECEPVPRNAPQDAGEDGDARPISR
jgi:hypothetical protein